MKTNTTDRSPMSQTPLRLGRRWATGLCASALLLVSGCMTSAMVAQKLENASNSRDLKVGTAQLRAHIDKLQAAGDPLGDYYYAMGNADGWITDVKDSKAITALFEQAAAKGSMDAKILLAFQVATGNEVPGRLDALKSPNRDIKEWERGLAMLEPLLKEQCYARRLVIDDGRARVKYYPIAGDIWPDFRDGHHRQNERGEWILKLPKSPELQRKWQSMADECRFPKNDFIPLQ